MNGIPGNQTHLRPVPSATVETGRTRTVNSARRESLTLERLKELLSYDPETGVFIRRTAKKGNPAGSIAGSKGEGIYIIVKVDNVPHLAHRLAWFYVNGEFPATDLDHRDGNKRNNQIENLRLTDRAQNTWNRGKQIRNISGYRGVYWNKADKCWRAKTVVRGKSYLVGSFKCRHEAGAACDAFRKQMHGDFYFDELESL